MPRILVAECKQEVSTFNPHESSYADFDVRKGQALFDYHRTVGTEVGGVLDVLGKTPGVEAVPTYGACFITSGGPLAKPAWERIEREFLEALRAAPPADGVVFCMHGAMASPAEADPEGKLLAEARRILGEEIPIVVSLDLQGSSPSGWWSTPRESSPTTPTPTSTSSGPASVPRGCCCASSPGRRRR